MRNIEKYITDRTWLSCSVVLAVGLVLRLVQIGSKSLWVDEAYAAGLMGMDPVGLVRMSVAGSPHPPLAFLFLRLSTMVFGQGEAGLRMIPALASALAAVPLMLLISRRTGMRPAFWAGLLWAAAPFAVSLGQEAWLYGILSLLGFCLLDTADRAWRGSRTALCLLVPVAITGSLVQHMFLLFVAAALGLYCTVPSGERISWKKLAAVSAVFIAFYSPFTLLMLKQATFRSERISRASLDMSMIYRYRLLSRVPTVLARLIPGGLLAEAGRGMLQQGRQLALWLFFSILDLVLALVLFFRSSLSVRFRLWLLMLIVVPLMLFLKEDPTVRHLCIMWVPLAFAAAAASERWKSAGPLLVLAAAVMLLPYYRIRSFPYHRSDWRGAVRLVEERAGTDEGILVLGGQSGGLAWDFYSTTDMPRTAYGGEEPYTERIAPGRSLEQTLDSLFTVYPSIWVVHDDWGGPSASELAAGHAVLWQTRVGQSMEVIHISF